MSILYSGKFNTQCRCWTLSCSFPPWHICNKILLLWYHAEGYGPAANIWWKKGTLGPL